MAQCFLPEYVKNMLFYADFFMECTVMFINLCIIGSWNVNLLFLHNFRRLSRLDLSSTFSAYSPLTKSTRS